MLRVPVDVPDSSSHGRQRLEPRYCPHVVTFAGSAGATRTVMNCTLGGIVGASVTETCSFPRSQLIVH
jgi:hypothetical protein